jgi:hypothetical protein
VLVPAQTGSSSCQWLWCGGVLVGNLHYPLGKCKKIHIVYN